MVSYLKTQWFNIMIGLAFLGFFICGWAYGEETIAVISLIAAVAWFITSRVDYNHERINLLEEKSEKYDALCEEVKALSEANKVDREQDKIQNLKIEELHSMLMEVHK